MQRSSGNALGTIRFQDSKLQDLGTTVDMSPSHTHTHVTLQQRDMTSSTADDVDVDATYHVTLVMKGLAYHHSGLPPDDRLLVEQLYIQGHIHGIPADMLHHCVPVSLTCSHT
jgi:hypothetical protein